MLAGWIFPHFRGGSVLLATMLQIGTGASLVILLHDAVLHYYSVTLRVLHCECDIVTLRVLHCECYIMTVIVLQCYIATL